ncbi:hypothetical protein [Cobetia sp. L2A1]|uniref:hypothetical protein n=1 Tax=Cobetia sp. L2A1 TaxID=2686360 RepID=UPI00131C7D08|nr:hypothetical protein [Cobetia sp. L2A1]
MDDNPASNDLMDDDPAINDLIDGELIVGDLMSDEKQREPSFASAPTQTIQITTRGIPMHDSSEKMSTNENKKSLEVKL